MVKLICPKCMKSVPVPDDFAGREVTCPGCMKPFEVPPRYNPAVVPDPAPANPVPPAPPQAPEPPAAASPPVPPAPPPRTPEPLPMSPDVPPERPTPPPGYVPPAPPPVAPPPHAAQPVPAGPMPLPAGYTKSRGITISPNRVAWLPAIFLTATLVFTWLPWVGSYLGGSAVYSQSAWGATFGGLSRNYALQQATTMPVEWLDKVRSDWEVMVPYLLFLLLATALAWADRGFHSLDPRNIPPLAKVWPWRKAVMGLFVGLAFLLLLLELGRGIGLERAAQQVVAEEVAPKREEAKGSPSRQAKLDYEEELLLAKYNLERTTWLRLAVAFNLLALVAIIGRSVLDRRGDKPPPRIVIQY